MAPTEVFSARSNSAEASALFSTLPPPTVTTAANDPSSAVKRSQPPAKSAVPVVPQSQLPNGTVNANGKSRAQLPPSESVPPKATTATTVLSKPVARLNAVASTSSGERERIRDFWLGLSELDRRALVKIEKEAVLRKMKEQQRHGCSCAVCGRKRWTGHLHQPELLDLKLLLYRSAIEEELEVLYDAYYDELEAYANHQQRYASSGGTIAPPPGPGPFPGSVDLKEYPSSSPAANKSTVKTVASKTAKDHKHSGKGGNHHNHSPSCPHHPHNHNHHHHNHGQVTAGRGKCPDPHHDENYESEDSEEDYDEDEDYDDDGKSIHPFFVCYRRKLYNRWLRWRWRWERPGFKRSWRGAESKS